MPTSIADLIEDAAHNFMDEVGALTGWRVCMGVSRDSETSTYTFTVLGPLAELSEDEILGLESKEELPGQVSICVPPQIFIGSVSERQDN